VNTSGEATEYCFQSQMWSKCFDVQVELTEVIRQSQPELISLLNEVRDGGELSAFVINMLSAFYRPIKWCPEEKPLKLFPRRQQVEDENNKMLKDLPGEEVIFKAIDGKNKTLLDKK
jgi:ATP-dependent DNA helicase PIF1